MLSQARKPRLSIGLNPTPPKSGASHTQIQASTRPAQDHAKIFGKAFKVDNSNRLAHPQIHRWRRQASPTGAPGATQLLPPPAECGGRRPCSAPPLPPPELPADIGGCVNRQSLLDRSTIHSCPQLHGDPDYVCSFRHPESFAQNPPYSARPQQVPGRQARNMTVV